MGFRPLGYVVYTLSQVYAVSGRITASASDSQTMARASGGQCSVAIPLDKTPPAA